MPQGNHLSKKMVIEPIEGHPPTFSEYEIKLYNLNLFI